MNISNCLYNALKSKYNSEIQEAKATLLIYFSNPVAIGEHPQHLEEMDKLISKMTDNEDKLECLEKNFSKLFNRNNNNLTTSNVNIMSNEIGTNTSNVSVTTN